MVLNTPFNCVECGYNLTEDRQKQLNEFLDEQQAVKLDFLTLIKALNFNKNLELMNETEYEANEYLDTFVALGG
jgi:hypothetical protein